MMMMLRQKQTSSRKTSTGQAEHDIGDVGTVIKMQVFSRSKFHQGNGYMPCVKFRTGTSGVLDCVMPPPHMSPMSCL